MSVGEVRLVRVTRNHTSAPGSVRPAASGLGRQPAFDGLRGVAWLVVFVAHANLIHDFALGQVSMFVFFALSGFLITSLLVAGTRSDRTRLASQFLRPTRAQAASGTLAFPGCLVAGRGRSGQPPVDHHRPRGRCRRRRADHHRVARGRRGAGLLQQLVRDQQPVVGLLSAGPPVVPGRRGAILPDLGATPRCGPVVPAPPGARSSLRC